MVVVPRRANHTRHRTGSARPGSDLQKTLAAVEQLGWPVVLLRRLSKRPSGANWLVTDDPGRVRRHIESGSNVGLLCGPESGVAVLDFDDLRAARAMMAVLGRLQPTVLTGSGNAHVYLPFEKGLPAKLRWNGSVVGEVQRGGVNSDGRPLRQQVVCPPSLHPATGRAYTWLCDPLEGLPSLPEQWRSHLFTPPTGARGLASETRRWLDRTPSGELLARAAALPGARTRSFGVKFRCPCCAADGHDRSCDNAVVMNNGRFGCAYGPGDSDEGRRHRRAIAEALGIGPRPWWSR